MGDLSEFLPKESKTVRAIYAWHKHVSVQEEPRGYLGASIIGHQCERYLWYCFRGPWGNEFEGIDGRLHRLFETGDLEEARFVKELRAIGVEVHEVDEQGNQWAIHALGGHFSGHMDGAGLGILEDPFTWMVLEFKTHSEKSFARLLDQGVYGSKQTHYAQMQAYMHHTGMKKALYLAKNKNTDDLYSEVVKYDSEFSAELMEKAKRIILSPVPPARIAKARSGFPCDWCDYKNLCYGDSHPTSELNCRRCANATPVIEGQGAEWKCDKCSDCIQSCENFIQIEPSGEINEQ